MSPDERQCGCGWCQGHPQEARARENASYIPGWGGYPRPLPRRAVQLDIAAWQQRCWEDHERLGQVAQTHVNAYQLKQLRLDMKELQALVAQLQAAVGKLPGRHRVGSHPELSGPFPGEEPLPIFVEPSDQGALRTTDERHR